jgi:hypothetical protein
VRARLENEHARDGGFLYLQRELVGGGTRLGMEDGG